MRKSAAVLALILLVCLLADVCTALADAPAMVTEAVVYNPDPKDRLNLRVKPDKTSESLGKYYNGTKVQILETVDAEWVKVRVGYTDSGYSEGYMMRDYLAFPRSADAAQPAGPVMRCITAGGFTLWKKPNHSADHVSDSASGEMWFHVRDVITVLGDLPNGWIHVSVVGSDIGSLRADDGGNVAFTGFVMPDRLALLRDGVGVTTQAAIEYDPAPEHPFSEAELNAAVAMILERFDSKYIGCVLDRLWYNEAQSDEILLNAPDKKVSPEWIVFLSDFHTLPGSETSGFEANSKYKGWMWFLHRSNRESPWQIDD